MGSGCKDQCLKFKSKEKFVRGVRYSENTCWCKTCNIWLDKITGLIDFKCACCHSKVRIAARAHWRSKKNGE